MTAARCVGCGEFSEQAILIRIIDVPSGPLPTLHACPGCRPRYSGGPEGALQAVRTAVQGSAWRRERRTAPVPRTVLVEVTVNADTVLVGDLVCFQGRCCAVRDMKALPGRRKRLIFHGGATCLLSPASSLTAYRAQTCS